MLYSATCFSGRHASAVPALPDRTVCAEHLDEELGIAAELSEMAEFAAAVANYQDYKTKCRVSRTREHPDAAKSLEDALRSYLGRKWPLVAAEGFRGNQQLDVVVPRDLGTPGFSASAHAFYGARGDRIAAHFEMAYRGTSSDLGTKLDEMLGALDATIRDAVRAGVTPPFTGVVLLGDAWTARAADVVDRLAARYAGKVVRTGSGRAECWPFPDMIIWPTSSMKKHDLFVRPSKTSKRVPCFMTMPLGGEPFRPLAVTRGFMLHRIRVLGGESRPNGPAWPQEQSGAICGRHPIAIARCEVPTLLLGSPGSHRTLWHWSEEEDASGRRRSIFLPKEPMPERLWIAGPRDRVVVGRWRTLPRQA